MYSAGQHSLASWNVLGDITKSVIGWDISLGMKVETIIYIFLTFVITM